MSFIFASWYSKNENLIGLKTMGDKLKDHEVECKSLF